MLFTPREESVLLHHLFATGTTQPDETSIGKLVYTYAQRKKKNVSPKWNKTQSADAKWIEEFLSRHGKLNEVCY